MPLSKQQAHGHALVSSGSQLYWNLPTYVELARLLRSSGRAHSLPRWTSASANAKHCWLQKLCSYSNAAILLKTAAILPKLLPRVCTGIQWPLLEHYSLMISHLELLSSRTTPSEIQGSAQCNDMVTPYFTSTALKLKKRARTTSFKVLFFLITMCSA